MNCILRFVSSFALAVVLAGTSAAACSAPEHKAPLQEPEGSVQFETKLPEKPVIPLVYAQDAGEKAPKLSIEERQRRALLYSAGANLVNLVALEQLLAAEAARRSSAGLRVGGTEITEEAVNAKVQEQVDMFLAQSPNGDFWRQRILEGYTEDAYRRTVALVLRVSDMFFPADPEIWPVEQLMEVFDAEAENSHWQPVKQELDGRIEMKQKGQAFPEMPSDFVFSYIMLPGVFAWMREQADIQYPSHGLPEGVALRVDGKDYKTADLLEQARPLISPVAEQLADEWVTAMDLAERELRAEGHWLSKGTLDAMWAAERKDYEGTIFTHEQTVLEFLGFPSMEHYRQYFEARRSFRTTLPDPFPEEAIQQQIAARGTFLGLGKVTADVILIAAVEPAALEFSMNPKIYRPGADPFQQYEATAQEVAQMLQDGEPFDDLLLEYSNFPARVEGGNFLQRDRGRFGSLSRADLRVLLGESDFTDVLQGYSIGDDMFFDAEIGAVYGPVRGPLGWYLYRVSSREEPTQVLDPKNDPRQAYQLEDDLISQSFLAFVNGLRR
jgi:hypothetical protein